VRPHPEAIAPREDSLNAQVTALWSSPAILQWAVFGHVNTGPIALATLGAGRHSENCWLRHIKDESRVGC